MIRRDAGLLAAASGFFGLGLTDAVDEELIPLLVSATKAARTVVVPMEYEMELFASLDSGATLARRPEMKGDGECRWCDAVRHDQHHSPMIW